MGWKDESNIPSKQIKKNPRILSILKEFGVSHNIFKENIS